MAVPLMFQPLVKYAQFEGRSRRSEFWLWVLFRYLFSQFVAAVAFAIIGPSFMQFAMHSQTYAGNPDAFLQAYMAAMEPWFRIMPFVGLISLALLIPSLAVGVRRLHDINRTGWWLVMPYVVMIVGFIVFFIVCGAMIFTTAQHHGGDVSASEGARTALQIVGFVFLCIVLPILISWIVMLVFFVTEGTKGANRFGPDPKVASPIGGI